MRWAVITVWPRPSAFPWAVFAVNVVGSALLGLVLAEEWTHPRSRLLLHDAAGIGFCGGLTTFSTFAVEVVSLGRDGRTALAVAYAVASVVASVAAVVAASAVFHRVRAIDVPLEEEP